MKIILPFLTLITLLPIGCTGGLKPSCDFARFTSEKGLPVPGLLGLARPDPPTTSAVYEILSQEALVPCRIEISTKWLKSNSSAMLSPGASEDRATSFL